MLMRKFPFLSYKDGERTMSKISKLSLKNCWEIHGCERHANGAKVHELGECVASRENMGHSCWAIVGTLCGDKVQCSLAEKYASCSRCEVYNQYHRTAGSHGHMIKELYPEENQKYRQLIVDRIRDIGWGKERKLSLEKCA